jgi:pentose-5-phosphate-3-epimerase
VNHEILTAIGRLGATPSGSIITVAPEDRLATAEQLVEAGAFVHADVLDDSFPMRDGVDAELLAVLAERWPEWLDVHLMAKHPRVATSLRLGSRIARLTIHVREGQAGGVRGFLDGAAEQLWLSIDPHRWSSADAVARLINGERPDGILMMLTPPGVPNVSADVTIVGSRPWREVKDRVSLGVDGGVQGDLLASIVDAGADYIVVGRSLFQRPCV